MERLSGGSRTDKAAHWLYDVVCTCDTVSRNQGNHCPRCGTMLLTAYHGASLYSVHCPTCSVVSLVKASNPASAEAQVAGNNQEGST